MKNKRITGMQAIELGITSTMFRPPYDFNTDTGYIDGRRYKRMKRRKIYVWITGRSR